MSLEGSCRDASLPPDDAITPARGEPPIGPGIASMTDSSGPSGIVAFADQLWAAEAERIPIEPISEARPDLTVADAYSIQAHNVRRRVDAGRRVRGCRLSHTDQSRQYVSGADAPAYGVLLDDMFLDEGAEVPTDHMLQPRVVATIAMVLASDISGPGLTIADALTSVAGVLPALEVVDSRIADWRGRLVDIVADNASAGKVCLGGRITAVTAVDLRLVGLLLHRNGVPIENAAGAAALGNPARSIARVAGALSASGGGLRRGDIVLAGPMHRLVPARPGDQFQVEFAHLGSVIVQFGDGGADV